MFLILPAGQGKRIGVKGLGGFVCNVSGSRVRLEIGERKYGLEVCDGTLKEGICFVLKPSRVPAGLGEEDEDEGEEDVRGGEAVGQKKR